MEPIPTIKITKLQAARMQLSTAIELWFADRDPVSTHALAFASHEIIHRVFRRRGYSDLLFDSGVVKDEYRDEFAKALKEDAGFIKHLNRADENETDAIDFKPGGNMLFIMMSIVALQIMKEPLEPVMNLR